jgi:hypothetical protein
MHLVSLIVGNGFDLNLGLQTSYSSFLRSGFFPHDDDPSSLAAHLRNRHEIDGWVDVEAEIARFSASQPARSTLKSEFKLLREALSDYIQSIDTKAALSDSKAFQFFKDLASTTQLNVISFNYTKTIDTIIDTLRSQGIHVVAHIINLHGTAESRDIIFWRGRSGRHLRTSLVFVQDNSRKLCREGHPSDAPTVSRDALVWPLSRLAGSHVLPRLLLSSG